MNKLIFLDVDGTLCDTSGVIPNSAKTAINKARQNGNMVYLSTGRSKSSINNQILDIGFDGMVASAGAYVESEGEVLFHKSLDKAVSDKLIGFFKRNNIEYILETTDGIYTAPEHIDKLNAIFGDLNMADAKKSDSYIGEINISDNIEKVEGVNKVVYFNSPVSIDKMQKELGDELLILASSIDFKGNNSGEISDRRINKSTGIQILLDNMGKTKEAVIAYGDGMNDIEMIRLAGLGIAMGNASEQLKKSADEVCDTVLNDGIYKSFEKHGLI